MFWGQQGFLYIYCRLKTLKVEVSLLVISKAAPTFVAIKAKKNLVENGFGSPGSAFKEKVVLISIYNAYFMARLPVPFMTLSYGTVSTDANCLVCGRSSHMPWMSCAFALGGFIFVAFLLTRGHLQWDTVRNSRWVSHSVQTLLCYCLFNRKGW